MAKYDPDWLRKAKYKDTLKALKGLSHILNDGHPICGKGFFSGITTVQFPDTNHLPSCRTCREIFLTSINIKFNENGYPL